MHAPLAFVKNELQWRSWLSSFFSLMTHTLFLQAVDSIDGEITQSFSQQRKKREAAGPAYYDSFTYAQGPFAPVPEVLHTKPESAAQQRVYEVWHQDLN